MWLRGNEPLKYPWGCRFNPRPCSMDQGTSIAVSCGYRPAAATPIQPLAWELPCVEGVALKRSKKKKKKKERERDREVFHVFLALLLTMRMQFTIHIFEPSPHRKGQNLGAWKRTKPWNTLSTLEEHVNKLGSTMGIILFRWNMAWGLNRWGCLRAIPNEKCRWKMRAEITLAWDKK